MPVTQSLTKRVLLMYITKFSGHWQATVAIQKCLKEMSPYVHCLSVNGFGYTYPLLEKIINKAYMSVIKRTPQVWDYLYDNPKVFKKSISIKNFLHKRSHKKLKRLFERYQPDTVVCTQAFPCGMVADYKLAKNLNFRLIGVLTDFAPHQYWIHEGVDYYVVPFEEAKERLIGYGVDSEKIKVFGIPIRQEFVQKLDKQMLAQKMALDPHVPVILVMGGGQGLGPIKNIVKNLLEIKLNVQVIVVTGVNKKIANGLKKIQSKTTKKLIILEYVENVDELMDLATLIISKSGGLTTAECLAKGLPMLIINPIPGQETRNAEFLMSKGIGILVKEDAAHIGREVESLLQTPARLKAMSQAAEAYSKPRAVLNIAQLILDNTQVGRPKLLAKLVS